VRFVRASIVAQKLSAAVAYAAFLVLFAKLADEDNRSRGGPLAWILFAIITLSGCVLKLATVGINVAIERDWVLCIADGSDARLTKLNVWMRRTDLLCKLLAPLFVSLLTSVRSYLFAAAFLLGMSCFTSVLEFFCNLSLPRVTFLFAFAITLTFTLSLGIQVVYRAFPVLHVDEELKSQQPAQPRQGPRRINLKKALHSSLADWREFLRLPVFLSSLSISCLYLTVLS
jgi:iron-regulated transporter 1